ncbi:YciI family protein [Streptomyces sp. NPDC008238]
MLHLLFLTYTGSEEEAGPFVAAHVAFLERHHRAGTFLLSGQAVPSSEGGVVLARGTDRRTIERIAAEDPLVVSGVAVYTVTTVDPARVHPVLAGLLGGA